MTALFTIGYEGRPLDRFIAELEAARIDRLIDVRIRPLSRKRGFSKSTLATALAAHDIEYVHVRAAGNPYRKEPWPTAKMLAKYGAQLPPPAVEEVAEAARGHRAVLLCFEADHAVCHRSVIAPRVAKVLKLRAVKNL